MLDVLVITRPDVLHIKHDFNTLPAHTSFFLVSY